MDVSSPAKLGQVGSSPAKSSQVKSVTKFSGTSSAQKSWLDWTWHMAQVAPSRVKPICLLLMLLHWFCFVWSWIVPLGMVSSFLLHYHWPMMPNLPFKGHQLHRHNDVPRVQLRLSMVRFANLLHQVQTCTEPKVRGAGACLLMNLNLSAGSGSDNLRTCTRRFELGAPIKILYI